MNAKILFSAFVLALAATRVADAGVLSSFLTFDGGVGTVVNNRDAGEDQLNDESRAKLIDNGDGVFSAGDIVFGMITISDVDASNGGGGSTNTTVNPQLAIVFSAKIVGSPAADVYSLAPIADSTNAHDLRKLLDSSVQPAGFSGWDSAIFAVITNPSTASADDPLNFNKLTPELEIAEFKAPGWTTEAIGGFAAGTNQHGSTDFFQFRDISSIGLPIIGFESGGFSILYHTLGGSTVFLPVTVSSFTGSVSAHDVIIDPGNTTISSTTDTPWQFRDNAAFVINAVPEPASVTLFTLGVLGMLGAGYRRHRMERKLAA